MGQQSSRIYIPCIGDHKDIYFNGKYHDKMYIGSQLVWEKISGQIVLNNVYIAKIVYIGHAKWYALISLSGLGYTLSFSSRKETSPLVRGASYMAVGTQLGSSIIFEKISEVDTSEKFVCITFDEENNTVSAVGTTKAYICNVGSNAVTCIEYGKALTDYGYFTLNSDLICGNQPNSGKYLIINYKDGTVEKEDTVGGFGVKFVLKGSVTAQMKFLRDYVNGGYYYTLEFFDESISYGHSTVTGIKEPNSCVLQFGFSVAENKLSFLVKRGTLVIQESVSPSADFKTINTFEFNSTFNARILQGACVSDTETCFLTEIDGAYGLNGNSNLSDFLKDEKLCKRVIWYSIGAYGTGNMWIDDASKISRAVYVKE